MPVLCLCTKTLLQLVAHSVERKTDYRDSGCKGLLLEVRPSGEATWYVAYRNAHGRRGQHRLGDWHDLSLHQARQLAHQWRSQLLLGHDPNASAPALLKSPRFGVFVEVDFLPHLRLSKRSWAGDDSLLRCHLLPVFGPQRMASITRADVVAFQLAKLDSGLAPGTVVRLMVLLRHAFKRALEWSVPGLRVNPCSSVPLPKLPYHRQRFLSTEEAQRLLKALRSSHNPQLEPIVQFLLLTGARKREALDARWDHIDWQQRRWFIPHTKTGYPRHVPLSDQALALLHRQQATHGGGAWLFTNPATGQPFQNIFCAWDRARQQAGLDGLRLHDCRHSFASFLINGGRTLYEVQQLLGHRSSAMTQRYAHLSQQTLLEAAQVAGAQLAAVHATPQTPVAVQAPQPLPQP